MTPHTEDNFLDPSLLERYCSGTASAEENAQIDVWFGAHPGRRVWYEQLRERLRNGAFVPFSPEESQSAWLETVQVVSQRSPDSKAKLMDVMPSPADTADANTADSAVRTYGEHSSQKLNMHRVSTARDAHRIFGRFTTSSVWTYATRTVIAAAVVVVGWIGVRHGLAQKRHPAFETYSTGNGQRATITLADGAIVTLNVASRLQVPTDYLSGNRTVRLTGEAMFTVPNHAGTPFTVLSGPTVTRVLGTSFVVRRYGTDTTTTVMVQAGKVAVDRTVVTRDQMIAVRQSGVSAINHADPSEFGFVQGVLALRTMSLQQAIPELDRWYDADVRLGDARLSTKPVEGKVSAGSLADLVELLSVTLDVRVVRDGRVLTLYPK